MARSGVVFLIEDDVDTLDSFREIMRITNPQVSVVTASEGVEALRILRVGLRPQVIVLDYFMPEMNGGEFLQILRRSTEFLSVPVIVASGMPRSYLKLPDHVEFVMKPYGIDFLYRVARLAQRRLTPALGVALQSEEEVLS